MTDSLMQAAGDVEAGKGYGNGEAHVDTLGQVHSAAIVTPSATGIVEAPKGGMKRPFSNDSVENQNGEQALGDPGMNGITPNKRVCVDSKSENGLSIAVQAGNANAADVLQQLTPESVTPSGRQRRTRTQSKRLRDLGDVKEQNTPSHSLKRSLGSLEQVAPVRAEGKSNLDSLLEKTKESSTLEQVVDMLNEVMPAHKGNNKHAKILRETYRILQLGSFTNRKTAIPFMAKMLWLLAGNAGEEAAVDAACAIDQSHLSESMIELIKRLGSRNLTSPEVLDVHFLGAPRPGKAGEKQVSLLDNFSQDLVKLAELSRVVLGLRQGDKATIGRIFKTQLLANQEIQCLSDKRTVEKEGRVDATGAGIICRCRDCNKGQKKLMSPKEFHSHANDHSCNYLQNIRFKKNGHSFEELLKLIESDEVAKADVHMDHCYKCKTGGTLLCCDGCTTTWHVECTTLTESPPDDMIWLCELCEMECKDGKRVIKKSAKRAWMSTSKRQDSRKKQENKKQDNKKQKTKQKTGRSGGYKPKADGQGRLRMKAPERHTGRPVRNLNRNKRLFEGEEGGLKSGMSVYYKARGEIILRGHIVINPAGTSGIFCDHCQKIISCSQFESHAGHAQRRQPYEHIYVEEEGVNLKKIAARLPDRSTHAGEQEEVGHDIYSDLDALAGGCTFCREPDFQKGEFGPRTIMICDQCEREFHVGCLEEHGLCKLESLPEGDWFCDQACGRIHGHFKALVGSGTMGAEFLHPSGNKTNNASIFQFSTTDVQVQSYKDAMSDMTDSDLLASGMRRSSRTCVIAPKSNVVESESPYKLELEDYTWQILNGEDGTQETHQAIEEATSLLQESFDPIMDLSTNTDLLPLMINAEQYGDWDYRGVHTILLKHRSTPVVAAVVRVFGPQMAELPLIATSKSQRRRGHAKVLVDLFQYHLKQAGVHRLVLPAAHETVVAWKGGFQFIDMPSDQVRLAKHQLKVLVFPGTEMLWKQIDGVTEPTGHHVLEPIISEEDENELISVVKDIVQRVEKQHEFEMKSTVKVTFRHEPEIVKVAFEIIPPPTEEKDVMTNLPPTN